MSDKEKDNVRDINSARPFRKEAQNLFDKGWEPVPLPEKKKNNPPKGATGKSAPPVDQDDVTGWLQDRTYLKSNVAVRMGTTEVDGKWYEVIGIDVDHYMDKAENGEEKFKNGGDELEELENEYGALPETWTCTARNDGKSGTRYYRVPMEYDADDEEWRRFHYKGRASTYVDIIQGGHRYSLVEPSIHPDLDTSYLWYRPGAPLTGTPAKPYRGVREGENVRLTLDKEDRGAPNVWDLAILPEAWVDFLTGDKMWATEDPIDMGPTSDEMEEWARKNLSKGKEPCVKSRAKLELWMKRLKEDASSHDKILEAHWNILRDASPLEFGHTGWARMTSAFETAWRKDVEARGKRTEDEADMEIFRSRIQAFRKIKAEMDIAAENGKRIVPAKTCACSHIKKEGRAKGPEEYDQTDYGNAQHFMDLYPERFAWVNGFRTWIYWDGKKWIRDADGLVNRRFGKVRKRQQAHAEELRVRAAKARGNETKQTDEDKEFIRWDKWANRSGMKNPIKDAIEVSQTLKGVTLPANIWDNNGDFLATADGVLVLGPKGKELDFRPAKKDDYITHSTNTIYKPWHEHAGTRGYDLWQQYLDTFFPDENADLRRFVQKAFGYCLLSGNPDRLTLFLRGLSGSGKSTMLTAIMAAMGDYADTVSSGIFSGKFENPEMVQALPKRIVMLSEIDDHDNLDKSVFKRMCGGDVIACRELYANEIVRRIPGFVAAIATNSNPSIKGADDATEQRLCVIPFENYVEKDDQIGNMNTLIRENCGPAVLSWMVDGYKIFRQDEDGEKSGMRRETWPIAVKKLTKKFSSQLDEVGEFMGQCTRQSPKDHVDVQELYGAYQQWHSSQGYPENKRLPKPSLLKQLAAKGWPTTRARVEGRNNTKIMGMKLTVRNSLTKNWKK